MSNGPYATLMPLVREHLWAPDGKPPEAWDERREGSVLKRLLAHRSVSQIEVAILGLVQLRDRGEIDWLRPGQKVTSRALYNSRSGASQMFELATRAYWLTAKKRPKKRERTVGEILEHAIRVSEGRGTSERYRRYLNSPEWAAKRAGALARSGMRCEDCGAYGVPLEVHHLRYDSLGFEPDEDLRVLCLECHDRADARRRGDAA